MIIAVPMDENKKDVCVSFGRAPFFLFSNSETGKNEFRTNPAAEASGGAGVTAAQAVVDGGADTLITVRCGENAAEVFKAANVKIYKADGSDAEANLKALAEGRLEELTHFHAGYHGIK